MLPWKKITVHHSFTKDSKTVSWNAIDDYHISTMGWRFNGYHAGIENVGGDYQVFYGRPLDYMGAHTKGENAHALGLCFVGNYDVIAPPIAMLRVACERAIRPWMKMFDIPEAQIWPHRVFAPWKSCPGNLFVMDRLIEVLRSLPKSDY